MRNKWQAILVLTVVALMVLAGCAPKDPQVIEKVVKETVVQKEVVKETVIVEGTPEVKVVTATPEETEGGSFIYCDFSDAENLNPILYNDNASQFSINMMFNGLIQLDPKDASVIPDLAKSWDVSEDEMTITYHLRDDVTWHDGEPFTADDVRFTFQSILNPDINSPRRADFEGLLQPENIVVLDDYTIEFTLDRVDASWLCCKDAYHIIPEHILGELTPEEFNTAAFNTSEPIGTGPYTFVEWVKDDHIKLVANTDYFEGAPKADEFYFKVVENQTVAFAQLQTDEVDITEVTAALWEEAQATEGIDCKAYPEFSFLFYAYNLDPDKTPLFQDVRTRQALLLALDRQAMADSIAFGLADVAQSTVPPLSWAHNPDNGPLYPYDPDQAMELLDEAGWRDEDGDGVREAHGVMAVEDGTPLSFELATNAGNQEREQSIVAMQQFWAQVGVEAIPTAVEWNALLDMLMKTYEYQVVVVGFGWDVDPDQKAMWHTDSYGAGFNLNKYSNPDLDAIIDAALETTDVETRKDLYFQMQAILAEEVPSPIIYFRRATECWNSRLHGYDPNDINRWDNAHLWWVE